MDANAYSLKVQPASKSLGVLIRKAQWMEQGSAPAREAAVALAVPVLPLAALPSALESPPSAAPVKAPTSQAVERKSIEVNGVKIFYREAGDPSKPTILLLHG
jgi:hypothetical protein